MTCHTETNPSAEPVRRQSASRRYLLRVLLLILAPVLFFSLLEAGLRLGGFGFPTRFFLGPDAQGFFSTNERFGWRFFPPPIARAPHPCVLKAKPDRGIRIFILGESAAMGVPDPAFSFGRILEVMLRDRYPDKHIEVVNAAITAINSHVVREIARDCAELEPDLFVVYMGNNEVIGPYGPGTVFQRWTPSLPMIRASIRLRSTRVGQLMGNLIGRFQRGAGAPKRWQGLRMFRKNHVAAEDPRLQAVYERFGHNLDDICSTALKAGAGVVLSTVAVNLRDFPPLASQHRPGLTPVQLTEWQAAYAAGNALQEADRWDEAIRRYEEAARIDDRHAELQFRMGVCLMEAGRTEEARHRFELARDLDALRFRADSRINGIIRDAAAAKAANGVRLADPERALAEDRTGRERIPGEEVFYEHVHLNFEGNYRLARTLLDPVCAALSDRGSAPATHDITSRASCEQQLVLTPWDEYQMAAKMVLLTSEEPFTAQMSYDVRQAAARKQRDDLRRRASTPQAREMAWKAYETALKHSSDDWNLYAHFAQLAMDWGRPFKAAEYLQYVIYTLPREPSLRRTLGDAFSALGRTDEALVQYRKALELSPHDLDTKVAIGATLWRGQHVDAAITQFRQILDVDPDHEMAHNNLGSALVSQGQLDEAIRHYRRAIELKPDYPEAHQNLGTAFLQMGRAEEAIEQFRTAIEIKPDYTEVYNKLGVLLAGRGHTSEAIACYATALELEPDNAIMHNNLAGLLFPAGRRDESVAHFQKAVDLQSNYLEARLNLAKALIGTGRPEDAVPHLRKALQLQPGNELALQQLKAIEQSAPQP